MAYRSDVDALEARLKDLEAQVGDRTRERDEVATLLAEARAVESAERYVAEAPQRRQRRRVIVIATLGVLGVLVGVLVAIRGSRTKQDDFNVTMAKFQEFADQMCRCSDAACAQKVSDDMTKWSVEMSKRQPVPHKLNEQQMKDATAIGTKMGECMQKAMTAGQETQP